MYKDAGPQVGPKFSSYWKRLQLNEHADHLLPVRCDSSNYIGFVFCTCRRGLWNNVIGSFKGAVLWSDAILLHKYILSSGQQWYNNNNIMVLLVKTRNPANINLCSTDEHRLVLEYVTWRSENNYPSQPTKRPWIAINSVGVLLNNYYCWIMTILKSPSLPFNI